MLTREAQDEDSEFPGRIESSVMASVQHLLFGADDLSS